LRFGIISDIHANLVALQAVLEDMGDVDQYWCLGDVVGYGPQPNECIDLLRELDHVVVMGNHDAAAAGVISMREFNSDARRSIQWTIRQLRDDNMKYLKEMPEHLEHEHVYLVHGSPSDPIWEYILTPEQAQEAFNFTKQQIIFVGHSHIQMVFAHRKEGEPIAGRPEDDYALRIGSNRMLINPGSVGQPRDGDPRAAYAILDVDRELIEFHRVQYDIEKTQQMMRAIGSSEWLIQRLSYGR